MINDQRSGFPDHVMTSQGSNSMQNSGDIRMNTAKGHPLHDDIRMATAKGHSLYDDIRMETARGATTLKQGRFQVWERELLESSEVRRKATVAQLCKLNTDSTDDINSLHGFQFP